MLRVIRGLLLDIIDKIDSSSSDITEEDAMTLVSMLRRYTDKDVRMSKYQACRYLGISRTTFDYNVRKGLIPKGKKEQGFKELSWSKGDLDAFVIKTRKEG